MSDMRTNPAAVTTNAGKAITVPTWLVEISYPTPNALRFTSRGTITFDSRTFSIPGVRVNSIKEVSADFTVRNDDNSIAAIVGIEGANDTPCRIYAYYETSGVLLFDGFLDGCTIARKEIRFKATRLPAGMSSFPERAFTRRDFPYMPRKDKVITWNGANYTLSGRR